MKKHLIALTLMLCTCNALHAGQEWTPGTEKNVGVSYTYFSKDMLHLMSAKFDYNVYLNRHISVGGGVGTGAGWSGEEDGALINVPVTADIAFHLPLKTCAPYIDIQCGPAVAIAFADNAIGGGIEGFFNPHIGVKIPVWSETAVDLAVGYVRYGFSNDGYNGIEVKAGLSFGKGGSCSRAKARAKGRAGGGGTTANFKGGAELEYFTSCEDPGDNRMGSMYGVRGYALWSVFTPNLYAGITASIGVASHDIDDDFADYHYHENAFRFAIMPRVRYDIAEATFAKRINPFAQIDVGYAYNGVKSQFAVEPAVGISIKTDKGHSFDFSAGYLPKVYFDYGSKSDSGCIRIAAGYTF